jgi:hypothetical protein
MVVRVLFYEIFDIELFALDHLYVGGGARGAYEFEFRDGELARAAPAAV